MFIIKNGFFKGKGCLIVKELGEMGFLIPILVLDIYVKMSIRF